MSLVESGGANLMYQADILWTAGARFKPGAPVGRRHSADRRGARFIHGRRRLPAGLSDYVVLVKDRSSIYLAGPPLVKAAIGETPPTTNWAARLPCPRDRPGRYLAENDAHAIAIARDLMDHLPGTRPAGPTATCVRRCSTPGLLGIVPADERRALRRAREIIARASSMAHFPRIQGRVRLRRVCGHAHQGHRVGLIANNGPIQPNGSVKAAQFIQLCDQSGTPLVFLQNTTGYMVGTAAERGGPSSTAAR